MTWSRGLLPVLPRTKSPHWLIPLAAGLIVTSLALVASFGWLGWPERVGAASLPGSAAMGESATDDAAAPLEGSPDEEPADAPDPVLIAAGDIAACDQPGSAETAGLLDALGGTVASLGDTVYDEGSPAEFANCFEPTWGRYKARIRPAIGNHEYQTPGAAGYFGYFGAAAGSPATGYYSYDLGAWHILALNSNCKYVSCRGGSEQEQWVRADLAAHQAACTLAYWHHPRYSSGPYGDEPALQDLWQALYDGGADVVLTGHAHLYERFAPQNATGELDPRGIRQFTVGTGGASHYRVKKVVANSEVRNDETWGVLKLTLHPTAYDWQFVPVAGATFTDAGHADCHHAGGNA